MRAVIVFMALTTAALAEPRSGLQLVHDGASLRLAHVDPNGLELSYLDVPAQLRELGVKEGAVLLRGQWRDDVLEGEAFVFAPGCGPIAYPIRGVVSRAGALVVVGPTPRSCEDRTLHWNDSAVMKLEPPLQPRAAPAAKKEQRTKPKSEPAQPKPRTVRPAVPRQPPQYQSPYYQWRW